VAIVNTRFHVGPKTAEITIINYRRFIGCLDARFTQKLIAIKIARKFLFTVFGSWSYGGINTHFVHNTGVLINAVTYMSPSRAPAREL